MSHHNDGKTLSEISSIIGRTRSVIQRSISTFKERGSINVRGRSGRPPKTTAREDRIMVRLCLRNRFETAAGIARKMRSSHGVRVSRFTVSRRLVKVGLKARVPVAKPLISKKNQKARLQFAQEHVIWSEDQWSMVHFSDESKFNVIGSDGSRYIRRRVGERLSVNCVKKTVKHRGGTVMVWGIVSAAGTGPIVRLHGVVNAAVYKQLLIHHCIPYLQSFDIQPQIFMQDNAPCHSAKSVKSYIESKGVTLMSWPAQSPDLNPIKHIWKIIGDKVQE